MRALYWHTLSELKQLIRLPAFSIPTILFPLLIFVLTVLLNHGQFESDSDFGGYLLGGIAVMGVVGVLFFNYGVGVADERKSGLIRHLRTTPFTAFGFFGAKLIAGVILSAFSTGLVFMVGIAGFGVRLPYNLGSFVLILFLGALPFAAMGFALGYLTEPTAAVAIANLVYLPMSFLSGLFYHLEEAPVLLQRVAKLLPMTYYANATRTAMGEAPWEAISDLVRLAGFFLFFTAIAVWGYWKDEFAEYR